MPTNLSPEHLLIKFSMMNDKFKDDKQWIVDTDTEAIMAQVLLTSSSIRPSTLVIRVTENSSNLRNKALLSVAAEQCKSVSLQYSSSFWTPVSETTDQLKSALQTFQISNKRYFFIIYRLS